MGRAITKMLSPRLLTRVEAAAYCSVDLDTFERDCPVRPVILDHDEPIIRWDRRGLDSWGSPYGVIYAVGFDDFVKIGFTSQPLKMRLAGLQTGCPVRIDVLGATPGYKSEEKWMHSRFDAYRGEGEWFENKGRVARWIAEGCPL